MVNARPVNLPFAYQNSYLYKYLGRKILFYRQKERLAFFGTPLELSPF